MACLRFTLSSSSSRQRTRYRAPRVRGLTLRSSGAPTAKCQARSGGTLYIFASPGLSFSCRRPLSSNVRPRLKNLSVRLNTARQGWLRLASSRIHRAFSQLFNSSALPSLQLLGPGKASFTTSLFIGRLPLHRSPARRHREGPARGSPWAHLHHGRAQGTGPLACEA